MSWSTFSEVLDVVVYFGRNITIVCGAALGIAFGTAYWLYYKEGVPILPSVVSHLGILGIILMILGGLAVMASPARLLSRGETSRTHVQNMQHLRPEPSPWFGAGLSVLLSGIILFAVAVITSRG
ncbi:MAG: hypothetical protein HXS44_02110 [Theionarchaea archaeon]|nr:hypothetical protein [Theionarchaea archaeon]